jgi:starch phosphorylase
MNSARIAYVSMEIALDPRMPTYAGGLGILAGDTLRAAADLRVPMVGLTLLHRKGYPRQRLDASGWQSEESRDWQVESFATELPARVTVHLEGREVRIRAWSYEVKGDDGFCVPVCLLDTDLPENAEWDRALTHYLYGGDTYYRLLQEAVLGIGGARMLRALGHDAIERFHMNEGHAALLTLELLRESAQFAGRDFITRDDIAFARKRCIFTTHTPLPAGHDQFPLKLVARVLGWNRQMLDLRDVFCADFAANVLSRKEPIKQWSDVIEGHETLNLTYLALNLSHYINGVAKKHGEVTRQMFAGYTIDAITNGVHVGTWASPSFKELFDRHIPGWRMDNFSLRYAYGFPAAEVWAAHLQAKGALIEKINARTNAGFDSDTLTLGFARRATTYKRHLLLLHDPDRLRAIAAARGRLQIVYAGKAHPGDSGGKEMIQRIIGLKDSLRPEVRIAYLDNYDMELAQLLTSGVDVWVNTPQPPLEASGTSGMKAAINGVPSLSVLDGWWLEGCIEGATGWAIGPRFEPNVQGEDRSVEDAAALYDRLENAVLPAFYERKNEFIDMMKHAIALNGSFFNTHRMLQQYVLKAYFE